VTTESREVAPTFPPAPDAESPTAGRSTRWWSDLLAALRSTCRRPRDSPAIVDLVVTGPTTASVGGRDWADHRVGREFSGCRVGEISGCRVGELTDHRVGAGPQQPMPRTTSRPYGSTMVCD